MLHISLHGPTRLYATSRGTDFQRVVLLVDKVCFALKVCETGAEIMIVERPTIAFLGVKAVRKVLGTLRRSLPSVATSTLKPVGLAATHVHHLVTLWHR